METFRDILLQQVDTLQRYFDSCADEVTHPNDSRMSPDILDIDDFDDENVEEPHFTGVRHRDKGCTHESLAIHASHSIDFRGEAITFKATTAGILETLSFCIDLVAQREELWRRRVEKEVDRRKKAEELYKQAHEKLDEAKNTRPIVLGGPDYEEGPYCAIGEDEFFDAIDAALDKQDKEDELLLRHRNVVALPSAPPPLPMPSKTRLTPEIDKMVAEHINLLRAGCGLNKGNWECIADDGGMKVYRLELEEDGLVLDPLRAVQTVQGVTAHELCHYFYDPSIRMDWDLTLRLVACRSRRSRPTPASPTRPCTGACCAIDVAAADSLFWSQIRQVRDEEDEEAQPIWTASSTTRPSHPSCPVVKCVRIHLNVAFICQTMIDPPSEVEQLTRDHIRTRITYTADVNPGGWAPATVIRAVYKREYPRFVKRFSQFVKDVTANKPILF
ncbi:PREDICTED: collagen type IV alpha-3-binding protein-like isoform X2 [Priapulus caudatus]|nr:PREDICTED: collagen type IV alpha-3-binding protein-like isoform X2 [Priapulus caudatus]